MSNGNKNVTRDEQGGTLLILLAVIGAVGVLGALAAHQIPLRARLAASVEQRAVLRNLAEAGIVAAAASLRRGRPLPKTVLSGERIGRLVGATRVRGKTVAGGREITAEAKLTGPGAPSSPYRIAVTFVRGADRRWQVAQWRESFANSAAGPGGDPAQKGK